MEGYFGRSWIRQPFVAKTSKWVLDIFDWQRQYSTQDVGQLLFTLDLVRDKFIHVLFAGQFPASRN